LNDRLPFDLSTWIEVTSVIRLTPDPSTIAAFAIDRPQTGDRLRGAGLEISGWVIGRDAPVSGVRIVIDDTAEDFQPLEERRPDVAADYVDYPDAETSGFSIWAPVALRHHQALTLETRLADGQHVTLASFDIEVQQHPRKHVLGARSVEAPDFVIVGTQRGGTTSLYAYLNAHPQVAPAAVKETHYLTDRFARGLDWYLGLFPATLPSGIVTGEATPYALFHPLAAQRLRTVAPNAKVIALLRNPIERAYSQYAMERARGDETLDFAAALDAEPVRLTGEEDRLIAIPTYVSRAHKHYSYVARGEYLRQLQRWSEAFPPDQLLVLRSEDLYADSVETFARVTSFLGIDAQVEVPFTVHNRSDAPPIDSALRRRLAEHFAPHNVQLASQVDWDLDWH
jgi:hypothetical protein